MKGPFWLFFMKRSKLLITAINTHPTYQKSSKQPKKRSKMKKNLSKLKNP